MRQEGHKISPHEGQAVGLGTGRNSGGIVNKQEIKQAALAVYEEEDLVNLDSGKPDKGALRERLSALFYAREVYNRDEREVKALTGGQLVDLIFPSVTEADWPASQEDPEAVVDKLRDDMRAEVRASKDGPVQKYMGNGVTMCTTKITKDKIPAFYVTKDLDCRERDFNTPAYRRLTNHIEQQAKEQAAQLTRYPEEAARIRHAYKMQVQGALAKGENLLALAAASSADGAAAEPEPDES